MKRPEKATNYVLIILGAMSIEVGVAQLNKGTDNSFIGVDYVIKWRFSNNNLIDFEPMRSGSSEG